MSQRIRHLPESTMAPDLFALDKPYVASLTYKEINQMPNSELVDAIRASRIPLGTEVSRGLPHCGCDVLRRLLFLARETCRYQGY